MAQAAQVLTLFQGLVDFALAYRLCHVALLFRRSFIAFRGSGWNQ